jgi:hypothetical protein
MDAEQLSATNDGHTVKRCMPFLDALGAGWVCRSLRRSGWRSTTAAAPSTPTGLDREMVSTHAPFQVAGNPYEPRPPMKFHNHWTKRETRRRVHRNTQAADGWYGRMARARR